MLAQRKKEAVLGVSEMDPRDEDWDEFEGREAELDETAVDEEIDEVIGRFNDLRQARSGLRRPTSRPRARAEADKQALLANIPQCPECKGRHRVRPCPNTYARKDGFDTRKAEQSGTRCNYRDPSTSI